MEEKNVFPELPIEPTQRAEQTTPVADEPFKAEPLEEVPSQGAASSQNEEVFKEESETPEGETSPKSEKKKGFRAWWRAHKPTKRRLIQLYAALLTNANVKGFATGRIYKGATKNICVPGLNCYSCPGALYACPIGSLQAVLDSGTFKVSCYVFGLLMAFGVTSYTQAGMGVFGYTAYVNVAEGDISGMITAIVLTIVSVIAAFIAVYVTYSDEPVKKKKA